MAAVGDTVAYVPEIDQALIPASAGRLPWSWKYKDGKPVPPGTRIFRYHPFQPLQDPQNNPVEPDKPIAEWDATITALNEDGTAELDIAHPGNSWQLHYVKVRQDAGKAPGTWHERDTNGA